MMTSFWPCNTLMAKSSPAMRSMAADFLAQAKSRYREIVEEKWRFTKQFPHIVLGLFGMYQGYSLEACGRIQQGGGFGHGQAHHGGIAALEPGDERPRRTLDAIAPGLAVPIAAGNVGRDLGDRQALHAHGTDHVAFP